MKIVGIQKIHMVGIGGIGMSGIAEILLNQNFDVTGSDLYENENVIRLRNNNIKITIGHSAQNVAGADVVVYSSAVTKNNVEIKEAKRIGIPVVKRAEMLAEITRLHYTIGVAGTHGKTTTTSMLGLILIKAKMDPTIIVGGKLHAFGDSNARLGKGQFMVVEADEYDRSFLKLTPTIALLTNIDYDHVDIYKSINEVKTAFVEYSNKIPFYGFVVVCDDDSNIQNIKKSINANIITYGINRRSQYQARNIKEKGGEVSFSLYIKGNRIAEIDLKIPGEHNVRNALGAIATAHKIGIKMDAILSGIKAFKGVYRRFQIIGRYNDNVIVDDYAHHPTEIKASIDAAKKAWVNNRIIAIFQPHTYTRTLEMYEHFAMSLIHADVIIITDVYPARERKIMNVSGKMIVDACKMLKNNNVYYVKSIDMIPHVLKNILNHQDTVLFMGAGDIYTVIPKCCDMMMNHE